MKKLLREFYNRETTQVAKELLGKFLVHTSDGIQRIGKIVETEAYLGVHDLAAHSSKGKTPRTQVMFGPPGYAYVYLIYGMHHCMNIVTQEEGRASAVLIRALEPVQNVELRSSGPGLLCKAMHITKALSGHDMLSDDFYVADDGQDAQIEIVSRPRIGVDYAGEWAKELLRFYIKGNGFVSKV
ncbi:MAG: DNA-3-methyladenine glycosylase [Gammaproteobacteria bacterium]